MFYDVLHNAISVSEVVTDNAVINCNFTLRFFQNVFVLFRTALFTDIIIFHDKNKEKWKT